MSAPARVMIAVSQEFLPSLGGKQFSVDRTARLTRARGIADVEIIANVTDPEECKRFDAAYAFPVFRIDHPLLRAGKRIQMREGSAVSRFYGGTAPFTLRQKVLMAFFSVVRTWMLVFAICRRIAAHPRAAVLVQCHDFASLLAAAICRGMTGRKGRVRTMFVNGFIVSPSGFFLADACIRRLLTAADAVLCVSEASADALANGFRLDRARLTTYVNWIDLAEAGLDDLPASTWDRPYGERLDIVFVGQITPQKGIPQIMELARHIDERGLSDRYRLTIIGDFDHPMRDELARLASTSSCLRWLGKIGKPALWRKLFEEDVLFMPSQWAEGSGNVLIEAAACGLAVVSSRAGGIPEIAARLPHHRIVDAFDPPSLLAAFDDLRAQLIARGRPGVAEDGRRAVRSVFSPANFETFERVERRLLDDAARALP